MTEPKRLREGGGGNAAAVLMGGAKLEVPSAARQRALAFSGTAATLVASASGNALAAGGASLVKGVLLWVCVGTAGGGLLSLAVSETVSRLEAPAAPTQKPTTRRAAPAVAPSLPASTALATEPLLTPVAEPSPSPDPAPATTATRVATPNAASSKPTPPAPSLFDEQRIIEQARGAVAHGNPSSALSILDDYESSFPQGQFGPEALALRVEAFSAQGNTDRARALARLFQHRYPHHPLLTRVQATIQH